MRYISHYEEYPIYEPAEGGYYYSGNQLVASERKSKRACKKNLLEIWEECKQDNTERGFRVEKDGYKVQCLHCGEEIMLCDACFHSEDNECKFCDWCEENGCWRNRQEGDLIKCVNGKLKK